MCIFLACLGDLVADKTFIMHIMMTVQIED